MYLLASLLFVSYFALALGLPLEPDVSRTGDRKPPSALQQDTMPQLGVLPNPYPVPGKPYSILFMVGGELNRVDVRGCLSQAYKHVMGYIEQGRGEELISRLGILQTYRSVAFSLASIAARFIPLTYNDAKEVLDAFWLKSSEDGYRTRSARIIHDQGREIGIAVLYRKQQSEILSTRESSSSQANTTSLKFLPNPYDVPGKPFVMDWVMQSDALPRENVRGCLSQAYGEIQDHIERFGGDDPLPTDPRYLSNTFVNVRFGISGDLNSPPQFTLTYGDALPILEALWLKGSLEEYRGWVVNIISTKNDEHIGITQGRRAYREKKSFAFELWI